MSSARCPGNAEHERAGEQQHCEQQVRDRTRGDDRNPLVDVLAIERPRQILGIDRPFALVEHLDVAAQRYRGNRPFDRIRAPAARPDHAPEADREAQDLDAAPARDDEVPELVEHHEDPEHDEKRDDSGDRIHHAGKRELQPGAGRRARFGVGGERVVERVAAERDGHAIERLGAGRGNIGEANLPVEEGCDRDLVRRVEDCRCRPSGSERAIGEVDAREALAVRGLEGERAPAHELERGDARVDALRECERLRDRRAHIGMTELREHRPVDVFDERVDHAFRVDHDLDALARHAEQPVRFDHLEALVHHRRRVDADLSPHHPVGMGTGFVSADRMEFRNRALAERPPRRGQEDAANAGFGGIARIGRRKALKDGIVLAVDRKQRRAALGRGRHENRASDHEGLLVRKQNALAGERCRKRRPQACRADDRRDHGVRAGKRRGFGLSFVAGKNARGQPLPRERALQQPRGVGIGERGDLRAMPHAERGELFPLPMSGQRGDGKAIGVACDDVERRVSDRPRRPQHADGVRRHRRYACASSAAAGIAASSASIRSRTPP